MNIHIKKLSTSDIQKTIDMIKKTNKISFGKIYPDKLIDEFTNKYEYENFLKKMQDTVYFIATDTTSKNVLGVIGLKGNQLRTFFVDPDHQGKGIGRKLYDTLENLARTSGHKHLTLEGSPLGEPVYKRFGFTKIKIIQKEKVGIKYSDAFMKKNLL